MQKRNKLTGVIENERTLRFFKDEGAKKPLYQIFKAASDNASR